MDEEIKEIILMLFYVYKNKRELNLNFILNQLSQIDSNKFNSVSTINYLNGLQSEKLIKQESNQSPLIKIYSITKDGKNIINKLNDNKYYSYTKLFPSFDAQDRVENIEHLLFFGLLSAIFTYGLLHLASDKIKIFILLPLLIISVVFFFSTLSTILFLALRSISGMGNNWFKYLARLFVDKKHIVTVVILILVNIVSFIISKDFLEISNKNIIFAYLIEFVLLMINERKKIEEFIGSNCKKYLAKDK